jgi:hypothetical protein
MNLPRRPIRRPEIYLGDLVRALAALAPADDETREAIARALGMRLGLGRSQPTKPILAPSPTPYRLSLPPVPKRPATREWGEERTDPGTRVVDSRLTELDSGGEVGRYALCVGINDYGGRPWPYLSGSVNEIRDWTRALTNLGFPRHSVHVLTDSRATVKAIGETLGQFVRRAKAGDVLLFQFAGLSATMENTTFLLPYDVEDGRNVLRLENLRGLLAQAPSGTNVTCFLSTVEVRLPQTGIVSEQMSDLGSKPSSEMPILIACTRNRDAPDLRTAGLLSNSATNESFYESLRGEAGRAGTGARIRFECPPLLRAARFLAPRSQVPAEAFAVWETGPDPLPPSLFTPRWERSLLTTALATADDQGPLDIDRLVQVLAQARPVTALPRQIVPTLRRGVQVALDVGTAMTPLLRDQAELLAALRVVIGGDRLEVIRFIGTPLLHWAPSSQPWSEKPYAPPAAGTPVLLITDLGIGKAPATASESAGPDAWSEFARHLERAGCPAVALVPHGPKRWPPSQGRRMALMHWDHRTTVGRVRRWMRSHVLKAD